MRDEIKEAIGMTVQGMINNGLDSSFTKRELDELGVKMPEVDFSPEEIRRIRSLLNVSQDVFAKLLNVSLSSVRQWEQGKRKPTGSTMILLELLQKDPAILNYRLDVQAA